MKYNLRVRCAGTYTTNKTFCNTYHPLIYILLGFIFFLRITKINITSQLIVTVHHYNVVN